MTETILQYYSAESRLTTIGVYQSFVDELPNDLESIVQSIQGLLVYDVVAKDFYGISIPKDRLAEIHIRPVEKLFERIIALDNNSLQHPRDLENRLVGRCPHYARLLVAVLRAKGIPARPRCGFASYFNPGSFEDHSVCEYWNTKEERWILVDAQMDTVWRKKLKIDFDIFDVPRDRFIIASDAWTSCRTGNSNPEKFGITFEKMHGLWFIAVSLVHDLAVLNKQEVLQWDTWGAQPSIDETLTQDQLGLFDTIADLTNEPDLLFAEMRALYLDSRLRVPDKVFNALLNVVEVVEGVKETPLMRSSRIG